ncbi:serine hydrolase domain-containing protein [Planococcus lenghuensis]|uniref:Beta-lactamase-related domain-containing protein n=1 Tax=Planococcus lenghuensis TaxID=2213202 RepID=A0A1Q2KYI8_9BACL|nr:serine hydrolase domain-containing protein [Planococcus lenghuensis]AQQ53285.1 hypothetical protein B0X71_09465 [Planococcus lenghuensis]
MIIKERLNQLIDQQEFSGSVLITCGNHVTYTASIGMSNYELDVPNSSKTKYRIGSITKLITATAIMQLAERGQLRLDSSIEYYIPQYPAGRQISINHLLTHTSGIPNLTAFPDFMEWVKSESTLRETIDRFLSRPLEFVPGTAYAYSNSGYILLSYILEKITDQTYETYFQENIFDPLGMKSTGVDRQDSIIENRAAGYNLADGQLVNAPYINMRLPAGAASLYSTTGDLHLFSEGFFNGKLINETSRRKMMKKGFGDHALGWMVKRDKSELVAHHGGGIHGFSGNFMRYTDSNVTFILLSNVFYPKQKMEEFSKQLADHFFADGE